MVKYCNKTEKRKTNLLSESPHPKLPLNFDDTNCSFFSVLLDFKKLFPAPKHYISILFKGFIFSLLSEDVSSLCEM